MSDLDPPRIEFPCPNYPIKVMGDASEDFRDFVFQVIALYAPDYDHASATFRPSRNGRYESVNVAITATSLEQLEAIFTALKKNPATRMVL